jgi:hypothetical protein
MESKTIHDKDSAMLPSIEELRASQKKGATGKGMNPPDTKLNEEQGHEVEIKD